MLDPPELFIFLRLGQFNLVREGCVLLEKLFLLLLLRLVLRLKRLELLPQLLTLKQLAVGSQMLALLLLIKLQVQRCELVFERFHLVSVLLEFALEFGVFVFHLVGILYRLVLQLLCGIEEKRIDMVDIVCDPKIW